MNTKTILNIKTDKKLKEQAQMRAKELGFSLGTLVNAYLKQFVKSKTVYFSLNHRPEYIKELLEDLRKGDMDGPYYSVKELRKSLMK